MLRLIQHLNHEIIAPFRQAIETAAKRRQNEINQLEVVIEAYNKEHEAARNKLSANLEQNKSQIQSQHEPFIGRAESYQVRINSLKGSANEHLKKNSSSPPESQALFGYDNSANGTDLLKKAETEVTRASNILSEMQKIKIDGEVFKPINLGLLFLIISAIVAIYINFNYGGGCGGFLF